MAESLKKQVAKGAVWATLEKFSTQAVTFVVGMVLARLLTPTDYGTVALLGIFFTIASSLASCGFGNALVQRKNAGDLEFNSVFYTTLAVSFVVYAGMFFAAPWIAKFYDTPILCPLARVSALSFILHGINSVQGAELARKMAFDKRFRVGIIVCIVHAVSGISLAFAGFGPWALVYSSLLGTAVSVVASWTIIAWRPKWMFSFHTVKSLFSYGWKLSLSAMINSVYNELYGLLVGKFYTKADLAFVNKSRSMPKLLMNTANQTIAGVSFPALAKLQDDKEKFRDALRRMIQCSTFVVFPLLTMLSLTARPLTLLLYGSQWEEAIKYVPIGCFALALGPITSLNCMAISALGRSGVFLVLECVKKGSGLVLMLLSIRYGVMAFVATMAFIQGPFAVLANTWTNGRLIGYSFRMQMRDLLPSIGLCAAMAAIIALIPILLLPLLSHVPSQNLAYAIELIVSGLAGFGTYIVLALHFRLRPLREYCNILLPILQKRLPKLANHIGAVKWERGSNV